MGVFPSSLVAFKLGSWVSALAVAASSWASAGLEAESERADRRPLAIDRSPAEIVSLVSRAFEDEEDWQVRSRQPDVGVVTLVHYTRFFRFPDDIEVRVEANRQGSGVLYARSRSRIGFYDFGQNARNLEQLTAIVSARCAEEGVDCHPLGR
ncbi:MAG: DUF1499 domain-containing protein [Acidobacteria bacterium]|nr:MAG: DUF1499 domain-containing protein [Acidobacteriota bacterium]